MEKPISVYLDSGQDEEFEQFVAELFQHVDYEYEYEYGYLTPNTEQTVRKLVQSVEHVNLLVTEHENVAGVHASISDGFLSIFRPSIKGYVACTLTTDEVLAQIQEGDALGADFGLQFNRKGAHIQDRALSTLIHELVHICQFTHGVNLDNTPEYYARPHEQEALILQMVILRSVKKHRPDLIRSARRLGLSTRAYSVSANTIWEVAKTLGQTDDSGGEVYSRYERIRDGLRENSTSHLQLMARELTPSFDLPTRLIQLKAA
jgi:hypothetical protein